MAHFLSLGGALLVGVKLTVAWRGPWFAECVFDDEAATVNGSAPLVIDTSTWRGTIDEGSSGTYGFQRRSRIVAGAGAWGKLLPPKHYHSDSGVSARRVAEDAAREAGETLGAFAPASATIGIDYTRGAGTASRALEDAIGATDWYVDAAGVTRVGARTIVTPDPTAYEVLSFDPMSRIAELAVYDVAAIVPGAQLVVGVDAPITIREVELTIDADTMRARAWCGEARRGRLAESVGAIVERLTDGKLFGMWRYRVVRMSGDRVELQAISLGVPDVLPISMAPGGAGLHAILTPSAEVLVQFVEGDRTRPVVTHFAGKDGVGHLPIELALCGGTRQVARIGDTVSSFLPPTMPVSGTVGGSPFTGLITVTSPLVGIIETGAPLVKA